MIKRIINNQDPKILRIEYMLGNLCNHRCNYCFPGSNEGNMPWPDIEIVKQNLGHMLNYYRSQGKEKSNIFFVGGEPTLWKELDNLCKFLKDNFDVIIEMSSNGSRKLDWWQNNARNFDHIGISVHHEYANVKHLIEVCDCLYDQGVLVNADVLIDPTAFDRCVEIVEELKNSRNNWPIIAKIVHFDGKHRYNDDQLKYFNESVKRYPSLEWYDSTRKKPSTEITIIKDNDEEIKVKSDSWITREKLNYFKGWECNLGVDIIKIFPDGRITGNCQQHLYGNAFDYNLYDTEFTEKFKPNIKPVICSKFICGCNEEVVCNKRKLNV